MGWTFSLENEPFANGGLKLCYKGIVTSGKFQHIDEGNEFVVKCIKANLYNRGMRVGTEDIEAQKLAQKYCQIYNRKAFTNKTLHMRVGTLYNFHTDHRNTAGIPVIVKGESVVLETFIYGEFEKFNNNSGWSNPDYKLPNFFSHYSWALSKGRHLVCDLQGHRGRENGPKLLDTNSHDYYLFTDPVVCSLPQSFGCTDMGMEGIKKFFWNHKCNWICEAAGIQHYRPVPYIDLGSRYMGTVSRF